MAPQDELAVGDTVEVSGMSEDAGMNGIVGILLKTVGRGRWALKVDGDEKSKVVPTANLRKLSIKGSGKTKYSIVGTWNDWEPKEMDWNDDSQCYEYAAVIGSDESESFKVLKNGEWDACIYPDRKDANPFEDHRILGPDDGGLNEEWTIGSHPKDQVAKGKRYKIMFRIANGKPLSMDWEPEAQPRQPKEPEKQAQPEKAIPTKPVVPVEEPKFELFGGQREPKQSQNDLLYTKKTADVIVEEERQARVRLMERFAAAAEAEPLAIEYDSANWAEEVADRERIDRNTQVEINKQRYRRSNYIAARGEEGIKADEMAKQMQHVARQCVECGRMTAAFWGNGCCEPCWQAWEKIKEGGVNTDVIPKNLPAGLRIYLRMQKSQLNAAAKEEGKAEAKEEGTAES
mmetsp:Transcript_38837/g.116085  ORF Transcript_38837/g.116085 Transcript_38837/m.116085 type:complete len:402 (+) Transcript_38837:35-1240(+)